MTTLNLMKIMNTVKTRNKLFSMSNSKKGWSKEAHAKAWLGLKEKIKNPTPPSYWRKKELLDQIPDDLPRY